jgi:tetratricopeptide (TPR) repeat protein
MMEFSNMYHVFSRFLALWLVLPLLVVAASASVALADDWNSGQRAFEDGDYASALHYFEQARDAGIDGPAVHYNIAASQFKLGRYEDAGRTFALIARRFPQMRGLAEYNLGLVAQRLGKVTEARAHFLRAHQLSPDNRTIRVLSSRRLRELEPEARAASRWSGAVGVRAGHDNNVALRDEAGLPAGTTSESPMADVFATVQGPWNGKSGFRLDASAYLVKYFDADEFDQSQLQGGVFYDWRPNDWRLQVGVHASASTLGGDGFDRKVGANFVAIRYFGHHSAIDLRYTHDEVSEADSLFSGIAGSRQQAHLRYRWYRDGHRLQVHYGLETNDRTDPGVSPERMRFGIAYRFQPARGIGYDVGVEFRNSDYDELVPSRDEDLLALSAALTYALPTDLRLSLELRHSDNDSTDATFSYERTQLMIGAVKLF